MTNKVPSVLLKICDKKKREVDALYESGMADEYTHQAKNYLSKRDFKAAITKPGMNLIAEFKRASPSKGDIRPGVEPEEIVKMYQRCGAAAISVLTDSHFKGELDYLVRVNKAVDIPILRKDFIIDPIQIYEARSNGADAILLIAAILKPEEIRSYITIAKSMNMDCLVESHNRYELEKSIEGRAEIYGINNRNLHDFTTDRKTTTELLKYIPISGPLVVGKNPPIVTESAILNYEHVQELSHPRVNAMLVGEAIMSKKINPTLSDMENKIYELLGK